MNQRNEIITWDEVSRLIDHLPPQFNRVYNVMVMIAASGGIILGMLSGSHERPKLLFTASVDFLAEAHTTPPQSKFLTCCTEVWTLRHPELTNVLIVDDALGPAHYHRRQNR